MSSNNDALRPVSFDAYKGQPALVNLLKIRTRAAKARKEPLTHVLLSGPPGLGKTTLAHVIANEMGSKSHVLMGPGLEKPLDIINALCKLKAGDILFIDEIHACPRIVGEYLYPAMEDGTVELWTEANGVRYIITHKLPPFTLIGATTMPGLLERPLMERFGARLAMKFYDAETLAGILSRNAVKLGLDAEDEALTLLASRSRGTPRLANHLLRFARDIAVGGKVTLDVARESLELQEIDRLGLNDQDRQYLSFLISRPHPVGEQAIAAKLGLKRDTVAGVIEPYLLQLDLIDRTPRGRVATDKAIAHMRSLEPVAESFFATA